MEPPQSSHYVQKLIATLVHFLHTSLCHCRVGRGSLRPWGPIMAEESKDESKDPKLTGTPHRVLNVNIIWGCQILYSFTWPKKLRSSSLAQPDPVESSLDLG